MTDLVTEIREILYASAIERELKRPKCWNCDYLDGPYLYADVDNETEIENEEDILIPQNFFGFCHRSSAQADDPEGSFVWPQVDGDGWCGEHKQRPHQIELEVQTDVEEDAE